MSLNQPSNKYIFNKTSEDDMHKNNGFGFCKFPFLFQNVRKTIHTIVM